MLHIENDSRTTFQAAYWIVNGFESHSLHWCLAPLFSRPKKVLWGKVRFCNEYYDLEQTLKQRIGITLSYIRQADEEMVAYCLAEIYRELSSQYLDRNLTIHEDLEQLKAAFTSMGLFDSNTATLIR